MNCIDLTTNDQKCLVTSQNIENNSKLQKWSNYDEFASIWSRNDKNIDLRRKQFKTTQSYKRDQTTMNLHRVDFNTIKILTSVANSSKQRKATKLIKVQWIASIGCQNDQNNAKLQKWSKYHELHRFDFKTTKMLSYDAKHSKQRKTWKVTKIPWIASIWWQKDQNNAKLQKWSKYNDLHGFDDKTIKTTQNYESDQIIMNCIAIYDVKRIENVELRRKTFKTTQYYESDQIIMNCIDLTSKRSIMLSYVAKHSKQR